LAAEVISSAYSSGLWIPHFCFLRNLYATHFAILIRTAHYSPPQFFQSADRLLNFDTHRLDLVRHVYGPILVAALLNRYH